MIEPTEAHLYDTREVHLRYVEARKLPAITIALWMDLLKSHLPEKIGRIVDLGCGTGRFTAPLAETFDAVVIGIDLSAKMLEVARQQVPDAHLLRAGAELIPLADASADFVFMSMVYHHLQDRCTAIKEIRRILSPRGRLAIRTCTLENLDSYLYQRFFPAARHIDLARLDSRQACIETPTGAGFVICALKTVQQVTAQNPQMYLSKTQQRGTSDLEMISDEEFAAGMAALREYLRTLPPDLPICEELDLLVFQAAD